MIRTKKNVLIIDDSESICQAISIELREQGFETTMALNGQDGLSKLTAECDFKLIITDLNMPIMDGLSFLKEVRKMDKYQYVPVLILTTESQDTKKIEAKNAGATGWITKPFVREKLVSVVNKVIRS